MKLTYVLISLFTLASIPTLKAQVTAAEKQALKDLYDATNGPNWASETDGFIGDEWNFAGIVTSAWHGVTVQDGHVVQLNLEFNQLLGVIPSSIGDLVHLIYLNLSSNHLTSNIPDEIGNMVALQTLDLASNDISGNLPPGLGNLSNLENLYLYTNDLSGTIAPELGNLSNLEYLYLENNELSGAIPPELGNLSSLKTLWFSHNNLSGTLPSELGNIIALKFLYLDDNELNGSIPVELGNLSQLISLALHNNNFEGPIPPELSNLSSLIQLFLNNNNLSETIPPELGNLSSVQELRLENNNLSGIIPLELGNLTSLYTLSLNNNNLNGSIPTEIGNLPNLMELEIGNNNLEGNIPPEIINQTLISYFLAENNQFDFGNLEYTYQNADDINFGYIPQQKTDQPESLEVVEGSDIVLTTEISGTQNHYQWYKDGQPIFGALDFPNYPIIGATLEDAGTYYCVMTSDIITDLVLTRHNIDLVVTENPLAQPDEDWNMITVWDYDLNTNLKANTRRYYDDLGKPVQTQSLDVATSTIWGQATLYDYQGRAALSTLSAPIPGQGKFQYHTSFITNEGGVTYDTPDFDIDLFTPSKVLQDGPLGKYYNGVTSDQYQDVTAFPFSRTVFSELNPGTALAVVGGNKMDTNGDNTLTEEDEWPQAYSFTMPATDELSLEEAFSEVDYKTIQTLKTVIRDVHGNENVVFTDTDGKMLATARSGENGVLSPPMKLFIGEQGYVDVHIPKGINTGIWISNESAVTLYNLITDALEPTQASNLPPGFYRVAVNDLENYTPSTIFVRYNVNYYDYSLYEYDEVGRLVASYQPLVDENGGKLVTTYQYNTLGQLIKTTGPDQGTAEFKYRKDGQIRYSQNSEQVLVNEVSYTDYDNFGRPVESGVLVNVAFSNLDPDDPLPQVAKKETMATTYDFLEDGDYDFLGSLDADHQHPSFLTGNVAKTGNGNTTTYYSYDGYGRVKWVVQDINGLGAKTIDYGYEPLTGLVQKVIYQKGQEDQFVHRYSYNQRDQLVQVETAVDDNAFQLQAEYIYNDAGTLVRTEIADGAQGMDYVYNLAGQLKGINHPSLNPAKDPGGDANDLFGVQLDYHLGDYQRTENSNITTAPQGSDQFNGNIKGIRWQTSVSGAQESQYVYSYDRNNWLIGANFAPAGNTDAYDVGPIAYDANGNIQSLVRKKDPNDQNNTSMDDLTYHYDSQKPNRLLWVDDAISNVPDADDLNDQAKGNYGYNAIGQLVYDQSQEITYIYNASGLVAEVLRKGKTLVKFFYNDRNHRVRKETYDSGALLGTTYYVRDVAGQVMAVYSDAGGSMSLAEQPIYGAGRIGIAYTGNNNTKTYVYELTDHLGNVRAVFTKNGAENGQVEGYTDYYPFGMPMPGHSLLSADGYRYAFQGQEKDPETGKEAFELRLWDSRIGRWLTTDPYGQYNSPYVGMGNDPINGIDPDGGWKSRFGAWLWKTFNGGGEIVGEKGNWSVAQQGADGWDTFITNGDFSGKPSQYLNLNYTPLPGATIGAENMKGNNPFLGKKWGWFENRLSGDKFYGIGSEEYGNNKGKYGTVYGSQDYNDWVIPPGGGANLRFWAHKTNTLNYMLKATRDGVGAVNQANNVASVIIEPVDNDTITYLLQAWKNGVHSGGIGGEYKGVKSSNGRIRDYFESGNTNEWDSIQKVQLYGN